MSKIEAIMPTLHTYDKKQGIPVLDRNREKKSQVNTFQWMLDAELGKTNQANVRMEQDLQHLRNGGYIRVEPPVDMGDVK